MCDMGQVQQLQKLLQQYEESKNAFEAAKNHKGAIPLSPSDIMNSIKALFSLKVNGKKIKELYDAQNKSRHKEFKNTEYVHKGPVNKFVDPGTADKSKKQNNKKGKSDKKDTRDKSTDRSKDKDDDKSKKKPKGMYCKLLAKISSAYFHTDTF